MEIRKELIISFGLIFRQKWKGDIKNTQTLSDGGNNSKMGATSWKINVDDNLEIDEKWLRRLLYEVDDIFGKENELCL